jgi:uncharacterized protein YciI
MRYVALIGHGPNWLDGRSVYEQGEPIEGHLRTMGQRYDEGTLLLGGPFESGHQGIAVLNVADESEARDIMEADPGVQAGVLGYDLKLLTAYFDAFDGTRTTTRASELGDRRRTTDS